MAEKPWHRRFHEDALEGMADLPLEIRGAYDTIMNLIYKRGCRIEDDDYELLPRMGPGCSMQRWRKIKFQLVALGKIYVENGLIGNRRADKELRDDMRYRLQQAASGSVGGTRSGAVRRKTSKKSSRKIREKNAKFLQSGEAKPSKSTDVFVGDAKADNNNPEASLQEKISVNRTHLTSHIDSSFVGSADETHPSSNPEATSPGPASPPASLTGGGLAGRNEPKGLGRGLPQPVRAPSESAEAFATRLGKWEAANAAPTAEVIDLNARKASA